VLAQFAPEIVVVLGKLETSSGRGTRNAAATCGSAMTAPRARRLSAMWALGGWGRGQALERAAPSAA